jgi:hypothetical protein
MPSRWRVTDDEDYPGPQPLGAGLSGLSGLSGIISGDPAAPNPPSGLTATAVSSTTINLAWSNPGGTLTNVEVFRGTTSGGETLLTTLSGTVVNYADASCSANTKYYYEVKATNAAGTSNPSNEASATTFPSTPVGPFARNIFPAGVFCPNVFPGT